MVNPIYNEERKKSAESAGVSVEDYVKKLQRHFDDEAIIGQKSRTLFKGMEFSLPEPEALTGELLGFTLDKYDKNTYLSVLCPEFGDEGHVYHVAKGRFTREPRLVDNNGKFIRNGSLFKTEPLHGSFFDAYRSLDGTFGERLLALSKMLSDKKWHVLVSDEYEIRTSDYNNGTEMVTNYEFTIVKDADSKPVAQSTITNALKNYK
jgi:hypothetical protein